MCQSQANGGRRCDIGKRLGNKVSKAEYLEKTEQTVPSELVEEIKVLKKEHNDYQAHMEKKTEKRAAAIEEKKAREERSKLRKERQEQEAKEKAFKIANKKPSAVKPVQLYLSPKENQKFQELAISEFVSRKTNDGSLNTFLNKAAERKANKEGKSFTTYEEWSKNNGNAPEAYLAEYDLNVNEAGKLTRERVYDGVREKIEGKITLTNAGNKAVTSEFVVPQAQRSVRGRVQSNFGNQDDNSVRSEKTDIMLTEEGYQRVERISAIFGISKGDVMRNQANGIDNRIRQHHQGIAKYETRKANIAEYEKEGGKYRKKGESLDVFYERLITDREIVLGN